MREGKLEELKNSITNKLNNNVEISPLLFLWENTELLNEKVTQFWEDLLKSLDIPKVNLFTLKDLWDKIKISEIKTFLEKSNSTSPYRVQIFLIENFSRTTITWVNSCLKIFEEPWIQNLFFLTNKSESWILDTILSRVQNINLDLKKTDIKNEFYHNLISEAIESNNYKNLIWYFNKNKLEKGDHLIFLKTLILYIKENMIMIDILDELFDDINMIENNNVIAKNISDKWILEIIK